MRERREDGKESMEEEGREERDDEEETFAARYATPCYGIYAVLCCVMLPLLRCDRWDE